MDNSDLNREVLREHLPSYLISIHPGGRSIYLILIFLILLMLALLPVVSVQVSVSGAGIIRPVQEKTRITASSSGIVSKIYVKEGDRIRKTDPVLQFRSLETRENLMSKNSELREAEIHAVDLERLTSDPIKPPVSEVYGREYEAYLHQLDYLGLILIKAEKELARHEGLFRAGLISEKEFDDLMFSRNKAEKELNNFVSRSLNRWQNEYQTQLSGIRDLKMKIRNIEEEIHLTTVLAPATGNMIEFDGIFEGSVLQAGSVIGILSPDSGMVGEFYMPSEQIAYLDIGQKVQLQLDAFSAREWGFVCGEIYDISGDFIILNNQPVYRIKCRLDQTRLTLRNGYSSEIRKGMTFQARCLLRRRTFLQLLADKAENWLHPGLPGKSLIIHTESMP